MPNQLEKFKTQMDLRITVPLSLFWLGIYGMLEAQNDKPLRHLAAEPYNFFNHIGNVVLSGQVGFMAVMGSEIVSKHLTSSTERAAKAKAKSLAVAAGFAAGMVANGLVETKTGQKLIHWENTPDTIDFAYGVAASTATAAIAARPIVKAEDSDNLEGAYIFLKSVIRGEEEW